MDYLKGCSTRSLGGAGLFSTGLLRQEAMERTGGGLGGGAVAMLPTVPFELALQCLHLYIVSHVTFFEAIFGRVLDLFLARDDLPRKPCHEPYNT